MSIANRGVPAPRAFWIPFGAIAFLYLGAFLLLPARGFFITDGGCKFIQVQALIEHDYRSLAISWPGASLDPEGRYGPLAEPFGQYHHGKLYGFYSPTFTYVSALAFTGFGHRGLYLVSLLSGLVLLPLTWQLAGRLPAPRGGRPLSMVMVGLATPVWFYSLAFWEHLPATAFLVGGIVLWLRARASASRRALLASGVCCALAIHFRDELYLFATCLALMLLATGPDRGKKIAVFGTGLVLGLAPLWWVQWASFGQPWGAHLAGAADGGWGDTYARDRLEAVEVLLLRAHPSRSRAVMLVLPVLGLLVWRPACSPSRHRAMMRILASWALGTGAIVLVGGASAAIPMQWLLRSNGFFAAAPIVAWGLVRRHGATATDNDLRDLGRLVLLYLVLYVLATPVGNVAGIHWGCRLLLPLYPLLGTMAASNLAEWWKSHPGKGDLALVTSVVLISITAQLFSLRLLDQRRSFDAEVNRIVAERPEKMIAAVGWNVPMQLSESFYAKEIFMVRTPQQLGSLLLFLRDAGSSDVLVVSAVSLAGLPLSDRRQLVDATGFLLEMGSIDVRRVAPSEGG